MFIIALKNFWSCTITDDVTVMWQHSLESCYGN